MQYSIGALHSSGWRPVALQRTLSVRHGLARSAAVQRQTRACAHTSTPHGRALPPCTNRSQPCRGYIQHKATKYPTIVRPRRTAHAQAPGRTCSRKQPRHDALPLAAQPDWSVLCGAYARRAALADHTDIDLTRLHHTPTAETVPEKFDISTHRPTQVPTKATIHENPNWTARQSTCAGRGAQSAQQPMCPAGPQAGRAEQGTCTP